MNKFLLCVFLCICSGCAKDHIKPPANLVFRSIERDDSSLLYVIRYQSDVDVLNLFDRGERVGMASGMLECALSDDQDFSIKKFMRFTAFGVIQPEKDVSSKMGFSYLTRTFMSELSNGGGSQRDLSASELNQLLSNKQQIPCKVVVTAYGYKPYYSNTMNIPVADLLREINKPR
ncbi:hypothetical protein PS925_04463 [Pseudomonas fluorescens]|uniref:Lipoprotein n=1 Tax=Pseudomonas fluorescens TaxID=294 RepID=A0A5E7V3Q5_PSEFL|nr:MULTISPECIES: hypothetical protein [Pseudomonas]VVQ18592.1 hypothetical protein PS925_04463 [Pseudomonas fluorescens]